MLRGKHASIGLGVLLVCAGAPLAAARAGEAARATVQAAIKAHGGAANIAKTLTGTLRAKAKLNLAPGDETSIAWEETFELPRRYHRLIKGQLMGKGFSMEYAITDGTGWIRQNGGEAKDFKGDKLPLHRSWNAVLALLPVCLSEGVKLGAGGKEQVEGREAVGVSVSGEAFGGEAVLFFDSRSGLLVKSKRRMQHPLSREIVDGDVVLGDYREVSGVQYPHRIATFVAGKKIIEMQITRIEFLGKVEDRVFDRP
jgi:hypothetical protein